MVGLPFDFLFIKIIIRLMIISTESVLSEKYGKLKPLKELRLKNRRAFYCKCDCGNFKNIFLKYLRNGDTRSCGCINKKETSARFKKHGMSRTNEYNIWLAMISRCENVKNKSFLNYGGRGISVCSSWKKFENFIKDMGKKPENLTLDRIDNDGNYEPNNCRWATRKQQSRNTSRNVYIEYNGENMCVKDWAIKLGVRDKLIHERISYGWPIEKVLSIKI